MGFFRQARRLAHENLTVEEMREILRRASELQAEAKKREEEERKSWALRRGARAAGIEDRFLDQAIEEFRRKRERPHPITRGKEGISKFLKYAAIAGAIVVALLLIGGISGILSVIGIAFLVLVGLGLLLIPLIILGALLTVPAALLIACVSLLKAFGSMLRKPFDDDD